LARCLLIEDSGFVLKKGGKMPVKDKVDTEREKYRKNPGKNGEKEEAGKPGRMLVVDDEFGVLRALKRLFEKNGWEVTTAYSIELAEKFVEAYDFDVVIADYRLPGANGLDFLNKLRRKKPWIRGMLLSAHHDALMKSVYTMEGCVYPFLEKPWNEREILNWAQTLLNISRKLSRY